MLLRKWAFHFSTLAVTHFNSGTKVAINTTTLRASLLVNVLPLYDTPTFKTKELRLVSNIQCE